MLDEPKCNISNQSQMWERQTRQAGRTRPPWRPLPSLSREGVGCTRRRQRDLVQLSADAASIREFNCHYYWRAGSAKHRHWPNSGRHCAASIHWFVRHAAALKDEQEREEISFGGRRLSKNAINLKNMNGGREAPNTGIGQTVAAIVRIPFIGS